MDWLFPLSRSHAHSCFTSNSKGGYSRSSSKILRGIGQESQNSKFATDSIRVEIDDRDLRGGEKYWQWVKKGIPLTVEVGPRDLENGTVYVGRRDLGSKRESMERSQLIDSVSSILDENTEHLSDRALAFREENTRSIDDKEQLYAYFTSDNQSKPEIHGGFAWFIGIDPQWEEQLENDLKVTIRCIPEKKVSPVLVFLAGMKVHVG